MASAKPPDLGQAGAELPQFPDDALNLPVID
jgi:hypothetical protein